MTAQAAERVRRQIPGWAGQLARFAIIGAANTLIDAGVYYALTRWLAVDAVPAKGIAYTLGMLNSFLWNRSWTFRSRQDASRSAPRFILAQLSALAINTAVMCLLLNAPGFGESVSFVLATSASFVWNFLLSKYFVFQN